MGLVFLLLCPLELYLYRKLSVKLPPLWFHHLEPRKGLMHWQ